MRKTLLIALLALSPAALAANFGEPMPEGPTTDIAAAAADPAAFAGKPARFSGRITEVCQKKGCWVVLEQDGQTARVMAKDHGFSVPKDASGQAVAYGVLELEPISEEHARHLVEDDGAKAPAERELRIVATGIEILE
jgi:starvation-inducible outer membrane lipoprotein